MLVGRTAFFLLIVLFPLALESEAPEKPKVMEINPEEGKVNDANRRKGPKEEMREKIKTIKKLLGEVSALAEICGACDSNPCLNGGSCYEEGNGTYSCICASGWKGDRCEVCRKPLGMESGAISDGQISASSFEVEGDPARARLNFEVAPGKVGSWSSRFKDSKQWLQVDLGSRQRNVTGIATQGGTNYKKRERWVTRYKLQYSYDGVNFKYYKGQGETTDMVFVGNKDVDTIVYHDINPPIVARHLRVIPTGWRMWICMRLELYGCEEIKACDSSPCLNGGNCTDKAGGNFTCQCKTGWMGERCEEIKACDSSPCFNGGTCFDKAEGKYSCQCKSDYTGDRCEGVNAMGLEKSTIVGQSNDHLTALRDWLKPVAQSGYHWELCWRASQNGWAASQFHSKCDGKGPSITIIKVGQYIFGGYTSHSWSSSCAYRSDSKAFLFSLVNKPGRDPVKLPQTGIHNSNKAYSIYTCSSYGPTFGGGHDLNIANQASSGTASYTNLGHTYAAPSGYSYGNSAIQAFLAGTYNFKPDEVETFCEKM